MKYQEAFQQSKTCYGKILCTYAEIYNKTGKRLYSAQKGDFQGVQFAANEIQITRPNQMVPIRTSQEFKDQVRQSLAKRFSQDVYSEPRREYQQATGKYIYYYLNQYNKRVINDVAELLYTIDNNDIVYVKACALDWMPAKDPDYTSDDTATDEITRLEQQQQQQKKKITTGLLLAAAGLLID